MSAVNQKEVFNATVTADVNGSVVSLDQYFSEFVFQVVAAHTAGTIPLKIQHSGDGSNWHDLVAFTDITASGSELKFPSTSVLGQIRAVVASSTTPNAAVVVKVFYRNK